MNNLPPLPNESMKPDMPFFVEPLKSVFFQYFEQLVDACCMRIDLEFGLYLGKGRENIDKERYKKLIEYLRSVRGVIKRNYLLNLNEQFDQMDRKKVSPSAERINLTAVSLASDDSVKEDYICNLIIRQCQQKYHEDLIRLNQLLAVLLAKSTINHSQNPVTPEILVKALLQVLRPLKIGSPHRVALYKTFAENVFSQLGFIYHELIKQCESSIRARNFEKGVMDGTHKQGTAPVETVSDEFKQLQAKLADWRNYHKPSAYDPLNNECNLFFEHFEIKNALHILGQFYMRGAIQQDAEKQPLKWQVIKRLEELNFSEETKSLATVDEDVLDLVSLIFARIAGNPYLSGSFKSIVGPLIIPMSAACLGQYSVFTSQDHPIRQLLDTLFAAGLFLNPDGEDGQSVRRRISGIVKKLISGKGFETSGWTGAAKEFAQFLENQQQSGRLLEECSIQVKIDQEDLSSCQHTVANVINNCINNKDVPKTIVDFLKSAWKDAMLYTYTAKDQHPKLWENSVRTMNELIVSVIPPADDQERKQILKFIPEMIRELRKGLNCISYDKESQSRFFKELAILHIILMNKKEVKKTEAADGKIEITAEKITDCFSDQVKGLKTGDWLVFQLDNKKEWRKLARKSDINENLLFVDKYGDKKTLIEVDDLADQFRRGQAALAEFDDRPITDIVLSELYAFNSFTYH